MPLQPSRSVRYSITLGMVMALRMLGLFMVFPVLTLYARDLKAADLFSIGLALGIYGLAQASLQIPFGALSDRFGRRRMVVIGFLLFAAGSAVAAMANNIWQVVIGRFLQGSGAVAGVLTAWLADLVPDNFRTRAMALLGLCIGLAFLISIVIGPWVAAAFGLAGLFWLTGAFALLALLPLGLLPSPEPSQLEAPDAPVAFQVILPFAGCIFLLHAILAAAFLVIPRLLEQSGVVGAAQGEFYLMSLLASLLLTVPLVLLVERYKGVLIPVTGAVLVVASLIGLAGNKPALGVALALFFGGFNFLEAWLPAGASLASGRQRRGELLGAYSTAQFLGVFAGGAGGGLIAATYGVQAIVVAVGLLGVLLLAGVVYAASTQSAALSHG